MLMQSVLIALLTLFPLTILISYVVAVLLGHASADFPYISDTGTTVPESCVFGQMLNMCAFLFGTFIYCRFLQIQEYIKAYNLVSLRRASYASLACGSLSAFGVSIVANFQETSVFVVHVVGASVAFLSAGIFMVVEAFISFRTSPMCVPKPIPVIRSVIGVFFLIFFVLTNVFGPIATNMFSGRNERIWGPGDGGWGFHLVSTITEWIMAFLIVAFLVTYSNECHNTKVYAPTVKIVINDSRALINTSVVQEDQLTEES